MGMTEREARGFFDKLHQKILHDRFAEICTENDILALVESKDAWMELERYHAIGTVEEFKQLKEKATAKRPFGEPSEWTCPNCGEFHSEKQSHCTECNQAILWD